MRVDDYQQQAIGSDQSRGSATARFLLLGLFGEAGGVLTAVKKRERDAETSDKYLAQVSEELGDLLWYIAAVANRNGVKLSTLAAPIAKSASQLNSHIQFLEPDPKVVEQYQHVVIHASLRRDGVNGDMDWYCPARA